MRHNFFARMSKFCGKRILFSWILLIVYFFALLVGALHVHDSHEHIDEFECQDCINHSHHNGHIVNDTHHSTDCAICNFISTLYLDAKNVIISYTLPKASDLVFHAKCDLIRMESLIHNIRAPPFSC